MEKYYLTNLDKRAKQTNHVIRSKVDKAGQDQEITVSESERESDKLSPFAYYLDCYDSITHALVC